MATSATKALGVKYKKNLRTTCSTKLKVCADMIHN